jgi:hypothetical protein
MKEPQPSWEAAVGVVPCTDPYEWLLQAIRTFHVLEKFGMTHRKRAALAARTVLNLRGKVACKQTSVCHMFSLLLECIEAIAD